MWKSAFAVHRSLLAGSGEVKWTNKPCTRQSGHQMAEFYTLYPVDSNASLPSSIPNQLADMSLTRADSRGLA